MISNKKTILIFIDWFLPGFKSGGPVRSCINMIEHLKSNFNFKIITRDTDYCESIPYVNIKSNQWNKIEEHLEVYYFSVDKLNPKRFRTLINSVNADSFYVNGIYSFYFSILPLLILRSNTDKLIVASRGMLGQNAINVKSLKKNIFLGLVKIFGIYKKTRFHATNKQEESDIRKVSGSENIISIIPNLPRKIDLDVQQLDKEPASLKLIFLGRIAPEKNLIFALKVVSEINDSNLELDIFGPIYDQEYWKSCQQIIDRSNGRIRYMGVIDSEEVIETYKKYHYLFLPTFGENYGHVIIESFLAKTPVIISDKTPWIELKNKGIGWDIALNEFQHYVDIIRYCIDMNNQEYGIQCSKAFNYAKLMNDNSEVKLDYINLFNGK